MKTIAQAHAEWAAHVMPPNVHESQKVEMRRAFYSGFYSALHAMYDMAGESGESDDVGVTMIERPHRECRQFVANVQAGKPGY